MSPPRDDELKGVGSGGAAGERKSSADGAAGTLSNLKDPTQAHENLEIAKGVPIP